MGIFILRNYYNDNNICEDYICKTIFSYRKNPAPALIHVTLDQDPHDTDQDSNPGIVVVDIRFTKMFHPRPSKNV